MLNDLALQTRLSMFFQMFGPGVMFGSAQAIGTDQERLTFVLLGLGLVLTIGWTVTFVFWTRIVDRRIKAMLARTGAEIVTGQVTGIPAVGRVLRRRVARTAPSFLAGTPRPLPAPSIILAVTALADGGPRRVAALVPATVGLHSRRASVALLLHPSEQEAAVLDPRVTPEQLAAIADDPRWSSERLPTDRRVVGGWLPLALLAVVGLAAGLGLDRLVLALA